MYKTNSATTKFSLLLLCAFCLTGCSLDDIKAIIYKSLPFSLGLRQSKTYDTHISITKIKNEMKLVTAKRRLDFLQVFEGKDGPYIAIRTYEVKAGIDLNKSNKNGDDGFKVEILGSTNLGTVEIRADAEGNNSDNVGRIRIVTDVYEQKARDYAVELGILTDAQKMAEKVLNNITGEQIKTEVGEYFNTYRLKWLLLDLKIAGNAAILDDLEINENKDDMFYRDSLVISSKKEKWKIRIGDSGLPFKGDNKEFYKNVRDTNTGEENTGKDRVQIFMYFDPFHYKEEDAVLGYASDNYHTMFIYKHGRIYYVDLKDEKINKPEDRQARALVYLATSLREPEDDRKRNEEYEKYIDAFYKVQKAINSTESNLDEIPTLAEDLLRKNTRTKDKLSQEEKYIKALRQIKDLRWKSTNKIIATEDSDFDNLTELMFELFDAGTDFNTKEGREKSIDKAIRIDNNAKLKYNYVELTSAFKTARYLKQYFLQKQTMLGLDETETKKYIDALKSGNVIASRPVIAQLNDKKRNDFFYHLFESRLENARYSYDTGEKIEISKEERGDIMFACYHIPENKCQDLTGGDINERLTKINNGHEISNAFILLFSQQYFKFNLSILGVDLGVKDNDIHALIFDSATLRFFPNVYANNWAGDQLEKIKMNIKKLPFFKNEAPEYFYYGDWKKLRISPTGATINGKDLGTFSLTNDGKKDYRNSNDYAEKYVILSVIHELQRAYSNDDEDKYYLNALKTDLDNQIRRYVYEKIFRPSPRMKFITIEDKQRRYNYLN